MGVLDTIFEILQKPQGVAIGAIGGGLNQLGRALGTSKDEDQVELTKIFKDLDDAGANTKEYDYLRPRAQNFLSGIKEGWNNDVSPGKLISQRRPVEEWDKEDSGFGKVLGTVGDITIDPLAVAGAAGGLSKLAAASKIPGAASAASGANTFGKLEKGTSVATRLGQYGRLGVQGTLATGNPITGIGMGALLKAGENVGSTALRKAIPAGSSLAGAASRRISSTKYARKGYGNVDTGELFEAGPATVSKAASESAGAATPSSLIQQESLSRSVGSSRINFGDDQLALPRAGRTGRGVSPANPIPMGPIGSTNKISEQDLIEMLRQLSRKGG